MAIHLGIAGPCVGAGGLLGQLQLAEGADRLLLWAEELTQLQSSWAAERQAFLAQHLARKASEDEVSLAQRAWLDPLSDKMLMKHQWRQAELAWGLVEAKGKALKQCQALAQDCEHLEQASLKRQRLARCRLRREEERLVAREERLAREARERERREAARLEGEQARAEERRARLDREKRRLEVELERDRALWHRTTSTSATQTILSELPPCTAAPAAQGSGEEEYSDDDFDDESFESLSESEPEASSVISSASLRSPSASYSRSGLASSPELRRPAIARQGILNPPRRDSLTSIASSMMSETGSSFDRDRLGTRRAGRRESEAALESMASIASRRESLASIASSVDVPEESMQSIQSMS